MLIAITGGSGFIGNELLQNHLKLGDEVRVLSLRGGESGRHIQYFQADLTKPNYEDVLQSFVDGADILYHCAGELYNDGDAHSRSPKGAG